MNAHLSLGCPFVREGNGIWYGQLTLIWADSPPLASHLKAEHSMSYGFA